MKILNLPLFGILSLLIWSGPSALACELNLGLYCEIVKVSKEIKKICNPDDCILIGIGRSPTPLIAHLQNKYHDYAWSMPLSNFRYSDKEPIKEKDYEKLFSHFSHFLPNLRAVHKRRIMLLDYTLSGLSLESTKLYVTKFYKQLGKNAISPAPSIQSLALAAEGFNSPNRRSRVDQVIVVSTDSQLEKGFMKQEFDSCAPYGKFDITVDPLPWVHIENPSYGTFKASLKHYSRVGVCPNLNSLKGSLNSLN